MRRVSDIRAVDSTIAGRVKETVGMRDVGNIVAGGIENRRNFSARGDIGI